MALINEITKILRKIKSKPGTEHTVLIVLFAVTILYSFLLADKRYNNYEFGKFDLGNMAQIVWNTANGRFMEVTDQFGTNMPRWGMSHVDPILALFAPLFWFYQSPMLLVLAQHLLIISAIFPLYFLIKIKTKNSLAGFLVVLTYILYPANGFSLVWTGFHGISFTAPLFWFLERNNFLNSFKDSNFSKRKMTINKVIYWILVILMLMGKEEIGAILAMGSIFLYFKNKKLAMQTVIVSLVWFFLAFFVIIPSYANLRQQSITTFVERLGATEADIQSAGGDNFFISRYSYLGSNYAEIAKNIVLKPGLVINVISQDDKLTAVNNLLGPLGYVVILSPFWIVSLPDLAIVLLSKDEIFDISNHRIAFVVSSLFLSYVYLLAFLNSRFLKSKISAVKKLNIGLISTGFAFAVLFMSVWFSQKTENPLYISARSFVELKIVNRIFAKSVDYSASVSYKFGDIRRAKVPRNTKECLDEMNQIIEVYDPKIYTGPDYLGAH